MTDNNEVCNSQAYLNTVYQKQRRLLFNFPLTRFDNLANSPYPQYKQFDLDMRRKAEILQYKSSRMSTQTNSLTRAQRYKQLVDGTSQRRNLPNSFLQENTRQDGTVQLCPDIIVKTPTTAAGVPGPIMDLYLDPDIPVYNLNKDTNDYGVIMEEDTITPWVTTDISNIDCFNTTTFANPLYANLVSVYMLNVENPSYYFTVSFPFNIYIEALSKTDSPSEPYSETNIINVFDISFGVFYSENRVNLPSSPTISTQLNTISNITIQPQSTSSYEGFFANIYAGVITVSNIELYSQKGSIYDFQMIMSFSLNKSTNYDLYFQEPNIKGVLNTSQNTDTNNCLVSSSVTIPASFPKLTFMGI